MKRLEFSLSDFRARVNAILGIEPVIRRPYKLCDFKPTYGLLYPELFAKDDFWGHCDADVVFGDLRKFFPDQMFEGQVKVQMRGALSFYRNCERGNRLFQLEHPKIDYSAALGNHRYCGLDEWEGLHKLMKHNDVSFGFTNDLAEIAVSRRDLLLSHQPNYPRQIFTWEEGRVLRAAWDDDGEHVDEYAYIHLQKRPNVRFTVSSASNFAILPREIVGFSSSAQRKDLATRNRRSLMWEVGFHLSRVPRYLMSLMTVDRSYWRIPK